MKRLKVVFMGTPGFAAVALQAILDAGHEVAAVYTQPPKPAGRGQKDRPSAVQVLAQAAGIPVRCPTDLQDSATLAAFAELACDVAVVAAYGLFLPRAILELPPYGCLNIHASLLPRWRGAAPIERAILAGDAETGVTIMQMDEGLDTGPMIASRRLAIDRTMDAAGLHDALARLGAELIVEVLSRLPNGVTPVAQPVDGVTYARKISKEEARLDWCKPALDLERQVRAFSPKLGAFTQIGGERIKVLAAEFVSGASGPPGKVLDDRLCVACGSDGLRITRLQRPGKSAMSAEEFLRGYRLAEGTVLS